MPRWNPLEGMSLLGSPGVEWWQWVLFCEAGRVANDFDLGKLELTAGYTINKDMFLEFTVTPTIYGRDTAVGNTFGIAFIYAGHAKK